MNCEICEDEYEVTVGGYQIACPSCIGYIDPTGEPYCTNHYITNDDILYNERKTLADIIGCDMICDEE